MEKEAPGGLRYNQGKSRVDLLSPLAMMGTAAVLEFGSKKYAEGNWQKGISWRATIGCLLRHTFKFMMGEDMDPESGLPHVDHIACNAMFLQEYFRTRKSFDDRLKTEVEPSEVEPSVEAGRKRMMEEIEQADKRDEQLAKDVERLGQSSRTDLRNENGVPIAAIWYDKDRCAWTFTE